MRTVVKLSFTKRGSGPSIGTVVVTKIVRDNPPHDFERRKTRRKCPASYSH